NGPPAAGGLTIRQPSASRPVNTGPPVERVTGIEPALSAWEADVLPLNYTRGRRRRYPRAPESGASGRHAKPASAPRRNCVGAACDILTIAVRICLLEFATHRFRDALVRVARSVLIDEGGAHCVVAHPVHQVAGGG